MPNAGAVNVGEFIVGELNVAPLVNTLSPVPELATLTKTLLALVATALDAVKLDSVVVPVTLSVPLTDKLPVIAPPVDGKLAA